MAELRRNGSADFRASRETTLQDAILSAAGIVVDPAADDGLIVPGQNLGVALAVWNAGSLRARVTAADIEAPAGWSVGPGPAAASTAPVPLGTPGSSAGVGPGMDLRRFTVTPSADAALSEPYFLVRPRIGALYDWSAAPDSLRGEAFDPPLLMARVSLDLDGTPVTVRREVSWRFGDQAVGEIRRPILVVPAVAVSVSPELLVWPIGGGGSRPVTIELTHGARGTTSGELQLELPGGWPAVPAQRFTLDGEGTRRSFTFVIQAPAHLTPGSCEIHAVAVVGGQRFDRGVVMVDYPHIRPLQYTTSATIRVEAASLTLPTLRHVGYVRGAADVVPEALAVDRRPHHRAHGRRSRARRSVAVRRDRRRQQGL